MEIRDLLDTAATAVIALVAVMMGYLYIQDRTVPRSGSGIQYGDLIDGWEDLNQRGIQRGAEDPEIVITEFVDFQCPHCARLVPVFDTILSTFPDRVGVVVHHFPLIGHEYAVSAAIAAECAYEQDSFDEMYTTLLENQYLMGAESWEAFALMANVPDLTSFSHCISLPTDSFPRIAEGRRVGQANGVVGTPTTWVNGVVMPVSVDEIERMMRE